MNFKSRIRGQADDIPCIGRDFRFKEYNVKQIKSL
jgi:hypothetical protein